MILTTSLISVFLGIYLASASHHQYYNMQRQGVKPYYQARGHPAHKGQEGQQQPDAAEQYLMESDVKGVYKYFPNIGGPFHYVEPYVDGTWYTVPDYETRLKEQQKRFHQPDQQFEPVEKPQETPYEEKKDYKKKKGWRFLWPKKGGKKILGEQSKPQQSYSGQGEVKQEPTYQVPPPQSPPTQHPPQIPPQQRAASEQSQEEKPPTMMSDIKPRQGDEVHLTDYDAEQLRFMSDKLYDLFGLPYFLTNTCYGQPINDEKTALSISAVWSKLLEHLRSRLPQLHSLLYEFLDRVGTAKGYAYRRELTIKLINLIVNQVNLNQQIQQDEKGFITAVILLPIYAKSNRYERHDFSSFFELAEKNMSKSKTHLNFGKYEQWFMYCKYTVVCLDNPNVFDNDYIDRFSLKQRPFSPDTGPYDYFNSKTGFDLSLRELAAKQQISDSRVKNLIRILLQNAEGNPRLWSEEV
jgi:hypothetical protein